MVKLIMHGCNGRMGQVISGIVANDPACEIVAGIDIADLGIHKYPVFTAFEDCNVEADAIIDFSNASAVDALVAFAVEKQIPAVVCTTGLSDAQMENLKAASEKVAILKSANMSLGVNLLMELLASAAKVLGPAGYDIEIVEKHHNQKVDSPSGTALALADSINDALDQEYTYVYDRSQVRQKRDAKELGISAVRGGTIVGEHEVFFCGVDEVIEFKHTAYSRAVFGKGAVEAGKFLAGKGAGFYGMADVIKAK